MIIGLSGKKQSGKGECCKFLIRNARELFGCDSSEIKIFPFAEPLKRMCVDILGLTEEQVCGTDEQKNSLTQYRWEDLPHFDTLCLKDCNFTKTGQMTAREVLQQVGTNIFRRMNTNIWAEANLRKINKDTSYKTALIDDCRFPNEVDAIKKVGGIVIRLTRNIYQGQDTHDSETKLDGNNYDWSNFSGIINNDNMTIAQQNQELVNILKRFGLTK